MARKPPLPDYYGALGVASTAPLEAIRAAYLSLARSFHPDRQKGSGGGLADVFLSVQQAWEVLRDERTRREYDGSRMASRGSRGGGEFDDTPERPEPRCAPSPARSRPKPCLSARAARAPKSILPTAENAMTRSDRPLAHQQRRAVPMRTRARNVTGKTAPRR